MRLTITERSNLSDLFFERVAASSQALAYRQFRDGAWVDTCWEEVARAVGRWRAAFFQILYLRCKRKSNGT